MRRQGSVISRVCADLGRLPVHAPTESAITQQRAMLGLLCSPFRIPAVGGVHSLCGGEDLAFPPSDSGLAYARTRITRFPRVSSLRFRVCGLNRVI